jgi:hypothetical protein
MDDEVPARAPVLMIKTPEEQFGELEPREKLVCVLRAEVKALDQALREALDTMAQQASSHSDHQEAYRVLYERNVRLSNELTEAKQTIEQLSAPVIALPAKARGQKVLLDSAHLAVLQKHKELLQDMARDIHKPRTIKPEDKTIVLDRAPNELGSCARGSVPCREN